MKCKPRSHVSFQIHVFSFNVLLSFFHILFLSCCTFVEDSQPTLTRNVPYVCIEYFMVRISSKFDRCRVLLLEFKRVARFFLTVREEREREVVLREGNGEGRKGSPAQFRFSTTSLVDSSFFNFSTVGEEDCFSFYLTEMFLFTYIIF